jgi:hypothetical protein
MALLNRREDIDKPYPVIHGPLGIWPFPLLNTIIYIFWLLVQVPRQAGVEVRVQEETRRPKARTYNIIRDEKGRIIAIEEVIVE